MLAIIDTLKAGTMRGLLVAFVTWAISLSGLAELFPDSELYVDGALNILTGLSLLYAGYSRKFKPNPPLSPMALEKTRDMVAAGTLQTVA